MTRVLIVDDDFDVRSAIALVLEAYGLETLEAADGEEALALARQALPSLDVILLDMRMPRRSGAELLDELQHDENGLSRVPVVVLSGDESARHEAEERGVPWMKKPVDVDQLVETITRVAR